MAAEPSLITTPGGLSNAGNPNGRCGASDYGMIISADYLDKSGTPQHLESCLNTVAMPLTVKNCNGKDFTVIESQKALRKLAQSGALENSQIKWIATDSENPADELILTEIECLPSAPVLY